MLDILLQLDLLHNPLGVALAAVPAALNVGILAYALRALPRDRTSATFLVFVVGLIVWQAFDITVRSATSEETAAAWRALLRLGQMLAIPAGVHFALLFAERDRLATAPLVLGGLYVPPLLLDACYQAGFIQETLVHRPVWGWIAQPGMGPLHTANVTFFSLLALALPIVLGLHVLATRADPQRHAAAKLLAAGIAVPVVVGVFTEALLPELLGMQQIPLTSSTLSFFSLAAVVALTRYELFRVSTPAAAQAVLETMGDCLVIFRPDGGVLFANERAIATFGLDRARIRVHDLADLFTDRQAADAFRQRAWQRLLDGDELVGIESELAAGDREMPALLSLAPIPLRRHGPPGVVMIAHDVTDIREAQSDLARARAAAEAANRAKSLFLANMSHELRTPLNAVIGYAQLLAEEAEDEVPDFVADLRRIETSGTYLLQLINDILDLSKVESGKLEVRSEALDVAGIVGELRSTAEELCRQRGNRFVLEVGELPPVLADPIRLRQILLNLVSNGAKFTENGEVGLHVQVEADGPDRWVRFDVRDTGMGMNEEQLSKLFGMFVQVHEDQQGRFGGTGLGLALSKRLSQMMGGDITVTSTPGQGTTFTVRLLPAEVAVAVAS